MTSIQHTMAPIAKHATQVEFFREFGKEYGYADMGIDIDEFRKQEVPQLRGIPSAFFA